ncbi:MAG TPA: DUF1232 domain-containing protein [Actinobacteria bacterium]|nr:DUF1232 domain-containing protein [Actinomycetota bacterium]
MELIEKWRHYAKQLGMEIRALCLAYRDPRVSWYAKIFAACVVGYAFSPIDLIPDPIPVLGYLDDLIILPLGVFLALKMIPKEVMVESREKAKRVISEDKPTNWIAAGIIIAIWLLLAALVIIFVVKVIRK